MWESAENMSRKKDICPVLMVETYMQVRKQQLELDVDQQTSFK